MCNAFENNLVIKEEIKIIQNIIKDELWYEGERRHCFIDPNDQQVQSKVLIIVKNNGDKITNKAIKSIQNKRGILINTKEQSFFNDCPFFIALQLDIKFFH